MISLLLLEEEPLQACVSDVARVLAAEGLDARRIRCDGPSAISVAKGIDALIAFPSARHGAFTLREWVQQRDLKVPVLVVVAEGSDWREESPSGRPPDDFVFAPVRAHELVSRLRRLLAGRLHVEAVTAHLSTEFLERQLVGTAPAFVKALARTRVIAASDATVLITGETGTGKELFARAIHYLGKRRQHPFVPVDCGALPDQLFENELFGHERGAYTDAVGRQDGLARLAEGGTLFLDEVNSLSIGHQAKLLRFLQDRTYRPLGSSSYRRADLRIVAATNRDVRECIRGGEFRQDLFFRLNVLDLTLPPLRERGADSILLARYFLAQLAPTADFTPGALHALGAHDWPGNVRELYNVVSRAAAFVTTNAISADDLDVPKPAAPPASSSPGGGSFREARAQALCAFERHYLTELLAEVGGNISQAARVSGKGRRTIGRLVQKHQLKERV